MAFASYGRLAVDLNPPSAEPLGYPPTHSVSGTSLRVTERPRVISVSTLQP